MWQLPTLEEVLDNDPALADQLAAEDAPENAIVVPAELLKPTALLTTGRRAIKDFLRAEAHPRTELPRPHFSLLQPELHAHTVVRVGSAGIRVSRPMFNRAILLMDTLVKTFQKRALSLHFRDGHLIVGDPPAAVSVYISEVEIKGEKDDGSSYGGQSYHPSGIFRLVVKTIYSDRSIKDSEGKKLETQLNKFTRYVLIALAIDKLRYQRLQEDERRRAENARIVAAEAAVARAAEAERIRIAEFHRQQEIELLDRANAWQQATLIRAYIQARRSGQCRLADEDDGWATWAAAVADRIEDCGTPIAADTKPQEDQQARDRRIHAGLIAQLLDS